MSVEQTASFDFFLPLAAAYLVACGAWLVMRRAGRLWPEVPPAETRRKWLDLGLVAVVAIGILGLGQLWRVGLLLPRSAEGARGALFWTVNTAIIYSPVFVMLLYRRQGLNTVYLELRGSWVRALIGAAIGVSSVLVFLALRGQLSLLPEAMAAAIAPSSLANFLPVFLEGVAVAFVFVRLRWAFGRWAAVSIPALLFALSHVPGSLEAGTGPGSIAAFFVFNSILVASVLHVIALSRDVMWMGIVHYLMDVASGAFQ